MDKNTVVVLVPTSSKPSGTADDAVEAVALRAFDVLDVRLVEMHVSLGQVCQGQHALRNVTNAHLSAVKKSMLDHGFNYIQGILTSTMPGAALPTTMQDGVSVLATDDTCPLVAAAIVFLR